MRTVYAVLDTVNSIEIGQQYDHKATYVQFTNVNYQGTVYIRVEIGDYRNMIPLVDYGLIVGRPLTNQSGAVRAQLYAMTEDGDYEELSKVFNMIIKPSIGYSDPTDYPVEPNIEYIYNELLASKEASESQTQECLEQTQACQEATQTAISESSNLSQLKTDCETAKTECVNATSDCTEITETAEVYVPQAQQIVETWQNIGLDDLLADINALKTWKTNVEAGQTSVIVETEEETEGS